MKKTLKKIPAILCTMAVICGMTGCSDKVELEPTTEPEVQQEIQQDKTADYGDTITVSCEIIEQPIIWEDAGEAVFQVATTSEQFQNEFDLSEETSMKMVEKAIGKTVGESFSLWMEGGDGLYGYKYTIQEVVDKPADKVSYGDKVHTSYSMKSIGVDRGDDIMTGEQVIHVVDTDEFLARNELDYSVSTAESRIKSIVGKGVGDTFRIMQHSPEWSNSYLYTILKIDKAVTYCDTIRAAVRRASISGEERKVIFSQDDIKMELLAPDGTIELARNDLDMQNSAKFLREVQGKTIGESMFFSTMTEDERINYSITISDITSGKAATGYYETEALMMVSEENSKYIYDDADTVCYAIINDAESNMIYEYAGGNGSDYSLIYRYSYEPEYDAQGRLIKETYSGDFEEICEYKYNEQGICVEVKHSFPGTDFVYINYYDDAGLLVWTEEPEKNGCKTVMEYEQGDIICTKRTNYDSEGDVTVWEYDEWGFWVEPDMP